MPIERLQSAKAGDTSGLTNTLDVTFAEVTDGSAILLAIGHRSAGSDSQVTGITGPSGYTFERVAQAFNALGIGVEIWAAFGVPGHSGPTFTISFANNLYVCCQGAEYAGVERVAESAVDQTASDSGTSRTISTGTTDETVYTREVCFAGTAHSGTNVPTDPTGGFTLIDGVLGGPAGNRIITAAWDLQLSQTDEVGTTATLGATMAWAGAVVTLQGYQQPPVGVGVSDDFNREDSAEPGDDWQEFGDAGTGWRILNNALRVSAQSQTTASFGYVLHQTKVQADPLVIRFHARTGMASGSTTRLSVIARGVSKSGLSTRYELRIDATTGNGAIYRIDTLNQATLISDSLSVNLSQTYEEFTWIISNQAGKVHHEVLVDGSSVATADDIDPKRITRDGYFGFFGFADRGVVPPGQSRAIDIDCVAAYDQSYRTGLAGTHGLAGAFSGRMLAGLHRVATELTVTGRMLAGTHEVRNRIMARMLAGTHEVSGTILGRMLAGTFSHFLRISGRMLAGTHAHPIPISGRMLLGGHRVANDADSRYELYVGVDEAPDLDGEPDETFVSLPHTTTYELDPGHTYYLVTRLRNRWGVVSLNDTPTVLIIDDGGDVEPNPPSDPRDVALSAAAGGAVRATARYDYLQDGGDAADTWLIYLTSDGSDPDPDNDTPTEVAMIKSDGVARLNWTSDAFADETTVKAIVRVQRSSDDAESTNADIVSVVTDTDGPAAPTRVWVAAGREWGQAQDN